jgi:hypothetical protein
MKLRDVGRRQEERAPEREHRRQWRNGDNRGAARSRAVVAEIAAGMRLRGFQKDRQNGALGEVLRGAFKRLSIDKAELGSDLTDARSHDAQLYQMMGDAMA